MEVTKTNPKS